MQKFLTSLRSPRSTFRPAGEVHTAAESFRAPFFGGRRPKCSYRQQLGHKFEAAVHVHLTKQFGRFYVKNPWFRFLAGPRQVVRWCQPDGLVVFPEERRVYLIEAKLTHTHSAWHQMISLYIPVLQAAMFPKSAWDIIPLELCKVMEPDPRFDVLLHFPETPPTRPTVVVLPDLPSA